MQVEPPHHIERRACCGEQAEPAFLNNLRYFRSLKVGASGKKRLRLFDATVDGG